MNPNVLQGMLQRVEAGIENEGLKKMLRECIEDKMDENSIWSEITLHVHYMLGGNSPHAEKAATLTEMFLLALDIVDDLQDQDNVEKVWMKQPQAEAMNAVLSLQALVLAEMAAIGSSRLNGEIGGLLARTVGGQHMDVTHAVKTEQDYIKMVSRKSGSLVRLACLAGYALIDGLKQEVIATIDKMADCIGIIAQIANDVNDVLRYDVKNDLLHKKRTLPILFMLEDSREEFPLIAQYYDGEITREQFLEGKVACQQYVRDSGCIEYSLVIRTLYADRAKQLLQEVPGVESWKERFVKLVIET